MKLLSASAFLGLFAVLASPAFAKEDCDAGFRAHMSKMSTFVETVPVTDLAQAISQSLNAYNSCKAGDSFSPHGVWDQVIADMTAKSSK